MHIRVAALLLVGVAVEHISAENTPVDAGACATVADKLLMNGDLLPDSLKFSTPGPRTQVSLYITFQSAFELGTDSRAFLLSPLAP
eukprot:COSAG02_NODE_1645_length_11523_cov_10.783876_11_plen_86_part_00